jgi:hypothetical protein
LDPVAIALAVGLTRFGFWMSHLFGPSVPPFTLVLPLAQLYARTPVSWICWLVVLVFGFLLTGWHGVIACITGQVASAVLSSGIGMAWARVIYDRSGAAITASERSLFHAYRMMAGRVGVALSLGVSEEEMMPGNWQPLYAEYTIRCPDAASRSGYD